MIKFFYKIIVSQLAVSAEAVAVADQVEVALA